jgi:hypothetical protein
LKTAPDLALQQIRSDFSHLSVPPKNVGRRETAMDSMQMTNTSKISTLLEYIQNQKRLGSKSPCRLCIIMVYTIFTINLMKFNWVAISSQVSMVQ